MPINLETINSFFNKNFSPSKAKKFIDDQCKIFLKENYKNFEEKALSQIGSKLYNAFIKNYSIKQWDKLPKELPASIFNRLPLRFNYCEDYFNNCTWQGIPSSGYTEIFNRMLLNNKNIILDLEKKFYIENKYDVKFLTIYTGPLDELFNYNYGMLEWRSLKFVKSIINKNDFQGTTQINYPELKYKFTRIWEPKHLHPERTYTNNKTIIIKEFPVNDQKEPYYPINTSKNRSLHRHYKNLTRKLKKFTIGGRLADYAYYDMDMTISAALQKFKKIKEII
jgi:UDP-galactopyranose mutase